MKFTLNWLKDHLETEAPLADILDALTDLGLEVEGVEDPATTLGAFTLCRVIEAGPHPDADRLRLCRVEAWPNGPAVIWKRVGWDVSFGEGTDFDCGEGHQRRLL